MFDSLLKAALSPVDLNVGVASDVVTLAGTLSDQEKPYTAQAAERLVKNIQNAVKPKTEGWDV